MEFGACHQYLFQQPLNHIDKTFGLFFPYNTDTAVELIDALSANQTATSVVQLTLSPFFTRHYSILPHTINDYYRPRSLTKRQDTLEDKSLENANNRIQLHLCNHLKDEINLPVNLFAIDVTPRKRLYSKKLDDKGYVHSNEPVPGKKPVTIGHEYSCVAYLAEGDGKWALPLSIQRVKTQEKGTLIGMKQWADIISNEKLGFKGRLSVALGDCAYSSIENLHAASKQKGNVVIVRMRSNRVLMRPNVLPPVKTQGHPTWYDKKNPFKLQDNKTWFAPTGQKTVVWHTKKGKEYTVTIEVWCDLRSKGTSTCTMHNVPLTAVRITTVDQSGNKVYEKALWLVVVGSWQGKIAIENLWKYYSCRFDIEHFFRLGKLRLLMDAYQTPDTEHEENWMQFVMLSYHQLFHARKSAQDMANPWERKTKNKQELSPSRVQRDMPRLLKLSGPLSEPVKPRGKPNGRGLGELIGKRENHPIIVKSKVEKKIKQQIIINLPIDNERTPLKPRIKYEGVELELLPSNIQQIIASIKEVAPQINGPPG